MVMCVEIILTSQQQSRHKLGRPIAKASKLVMGFGGVALQGGLKGRGGHFSVGYFQNPAYPSRFPPIAYIIL